MFGAPLTHQYPAGQALAALPPPGQRRPAAHATTPLPLPLPAQVYPTGQLGQPDESLLVPTAHAVPAAQFEQEEQAMSPADA